MAFRAHLVLAPPIRAKRQLPHWLRSSLPCGHVAAIVRAVAAAAAAAAVAAAAAAAVAVVAAAAAAVAAGAAAAPAAATVAAAAGAASAGAAPTGPGAATARARPAWAATASDAAAAVSTGSNRHWVRFSEHGIDLPQNRNHVLVHQGHHTEDPLRLRPPSALVHARLRQVLFQRRRCQAVPLRHHIATVDASEAIHEQAGDLERVAEVTVLRHLPWRPGQLWRGVE